MYDQATLEKELKEIFERAKGCNTNNKSAPALLRRWSLCGLPGSQQEVAGASLFVRLRKAHVP